MKVKITDDYFLTSDAHNIILNKKSIIQEGKNKGKERLEAIGFYPSIVQAFDGLIRQKILHSTKRTLKGLVTEHHELLSDIREKFKSAKETLT